MAQRYMSTAAKFGAKVENDFKFGTDALYDWFRLPPCKPKSSAASPPARSSAPGHHHTDNERDGERLERCLPNQLG